MLKKSKILNEIHALCLTYSVTSYAPFYCSRWVLLKKYYIPAPTVGFITSYVGFYILSLEPRLEENWFIKVDFLYG